jgi:hypothetical protein
MTSAPRHDVLPPDERRTSTPAALAREVLQAFVERRFDVLPSLVHPEADLEAGFATPGARFDGRRVLDGAWAAASSGAYRPVYELVESLDDETALVSVTIRYEIGTDLFSEREAAYLMTFKDGLLSRNRIFDSVDEALAAHRAGPRH